MMVVAAVVVMVVVIVVLLAYEEVRFDIENAVEIEGTALEPIGKGGVTLLGSMQRRVRVDGADARFDLAQFGRADKIRLVDDNDVGEGDLVLGFGRVAQSLG